jgi:sugar phosphate isomerase/epimerase
MSSEVELLAAYWTIAGDVYPFAQDEVSPFSFRDRVEAAARAGYKGIGLIHADLMANARRLGLREMKAILDANGMRHVELEFIVDWFADGERRRASDVVRHDLLAAAEALGARDIKIAPEFEATDCDMPHLVEEFAALCRQAADHGTAIALELMPFSNVRTLRTALELVDGADQPNGGLLLDIWHVARSGIGYAAVAGVPAARIVSVELDDADAEVVGTLWEDTIFRRRLCGEGVLDPPSFLTALDTAGYRGPYAVEIISIEHRRLPLEQAARRSFETTMAQFARRRPAAALSRR